MIAANTIALVRTPPIANECPNFGFLAWCKSANLTLSESKKVRDFTTHGRTIEPGSYLYNAGAPFISLYAINSGFLKTTLADKDGREQVTGFCMAGEIAGLDAIGSGTHECDTIALEASSVCGMRYADFQRLMLAIPALQLHLVRMMGSEISRDQGLMLLLGMMSAGERVAVFLLNLSVRYAARGFSETRFRLPMSRAEIGSYLGLKLETVSRTLSHFQEIDAIAINGKSIYLKSIPTIRRMIAVYGSPKGH